MNRSLTCRRDQSRRPGRRNSRSQALLKQPRLRTVNKMAGRIAPGEMSNTESSRWLNRFAWFTAVATLFLICSGGMVTSKGVGLAVPDWPTTFGYNMFLFPFSRWVGGIFFEHTHRLLASLVGFLTIILALWLWFGDDRSSVRRLGFVALAAVILQGILGGLRVTMLKDEIGIFHALLAQAFLALLVFIATVTTRIWRRLDPIAGRTGGSVSFRTIVLVTTAAIYLQLALGATMRHQHRDLSILDFPTAYGSWLPDTSPERISQINAARDKLALSDVTPFQIWLQMAHRFGAVLVAAGTLAAALRVGSEFRGQILLRRLTLIWLALLFGQLTLGAWTIWSNKAADIATAHVALGATMLSFGVAIYAVATQLIRISVSAATTRVEAGAVTVA